MPTKISYVDETWNTIVGCSKASAGCTNCYAEKMAFRLGSMKAHKWTYGRVVNNCGDYEFRRQWNGNTVFVESALTKPLHWRKPRKIFVNSMGDTWHKSVPFEWIDRIMAVAALCPQHTFLFLTKRAGRMREYVCDYPSQNNDGNIMYSLQTEFPWESAEVFGGKPERYCDIVGCSELEASPAYELEEMKKPPTFPLHNVHLGVTVENQDNVGRIADLIQTPAAKRFLSIEPLLGSMPHIKELEQIDYAFIGCESGPGARLCTLDDILYLMSDCRDADVKIHIKQIPLDGKCNKNFNEWPTEFQVREV